MYRQAANENNQRLTVVRAGASKSRELHVITRKALLQALSGVQTDRERFLSLLRSRPLVTHADAIEALWGTSEHGGPLYAQNILAIYVSRLRRAGHVIENYAGIGYRIHEGRTAHRKHD
jgi:hypothetical protein